MKLLKETTIVCLLCKLPATCSVTGPWSEKNLHIFFLIITVNRSTFLFVGRKQKKSKEEESTQDKKL